MQTQSGIYYLSTAVRDLTFLLLIGKSPPDFIENDSLLHLNKPEARVFVIIDHQPKFYSFSRELKPLDTAVPLNRERFRVITGHSADFMGTPIYI